jgi:hypothetical protein
MDCLKINTEFTHAVEVLPGSPLYTSNKEMTFLFFYPLSAKGEERVGQRSTAGMS